TRLPALCLLALLSPGASPGAQNIAPPPEPIKPTEAQLKEIRERLEDLGEKLTRMKNKGIRDPWLADVEVYHKAGEWALRHGEFYTRGPKGKQTSDVDLALEVLGEGLIRANQQLLRAEDPW